MRIQKGKMQKLVQQVLEEEPMTRKSDELLKLAILKRVGVDTSASYEELALSGALKQVESITRCRRLVQEHHPELVDIEVASFRQDLEKQNREYYGGWLR